MEFIDVKGLKAGPIKLTIHRIAGPPPSDPVSVTFKQANKNTKTV